MVIDMRSVKCDRRCVRESHHDRTLLRSTQQSHTKPMPQCHSSTKLSLDLLYLPANVSRLPIAFMSMSRPRIGGIMYASSACALPHSVKSTYHCLPYYFWPSSSVLLRDFVFTDRLLRGS